MKSRTLIEVKEGKDAVLECGVRNLASHHTVGDFLFCFFLSSDASIRTGQAMHSLKPNNHCCDDLYFNQLSKSKPLTELYAAEEQVEVVDEEKL